MTYSYFPGSDLIQGYTTDTGYSLMRSYEPNRNLIASITNSFGGVSLHRFDYTNDQIGRRIQRADYDLSTSVSNFFAYNARSELEDAAMGTNTFNYRYDPIGNRRTSAISNQISKITTYAANSLNQYTNITDPPATSNPSYDLDGNMTGYKDWTFVWDAENRLVLASNATTVVSNSYDYMSRRVAKVVNGQASIFAYQGWAMIAESTVTSTNSYIYGLDLSGTAQGAGTIGGILAANLNGTTAFYAYDANGNVTDLVDTNGAVVAQYQFDPYGNTISKSGTLADVNPFRFSTKYLDAETGMYYYGYRQYSPELGRWLSRDPLDEQGGINLYGFVQNDPLDLVDDLGMSIMGGAWGMFFHYFGFAPDSGQLDGTILQNIKNSWHMKNWKTTIELLLGKRVICCSKGQEHLSDASNEGLDDVIPLGLSLWGASSAGKWQIQLIADCSWKGGNPDSSGKCKYDANCSMKATVSKLYTFQATQNGNPANNWWWVKFLNWFATMNNWGQTPHFDVSGHVTDQWNWTGNK